VCVCVRVYVRCVTVCEYLWCVCLGMSEVCLCGVCVSVSVYMCVV